LQKRDRGYVKEKVKKGKEKKEGRKKWTQRCPEY
jgi:hypothetical protein